MNYRICKFHLSSDRAAVIEQHPQASADCDTGTIILRFEEWIGLDARQKIVEAMNTAEINARELSPATH